MANLYALDFGRQKRKRQFGSPISEEKCPNKIVIDNVPLTLPPGICFAPSDAELVNYLKMRVMNLPLPNSVGIKDFNVYGCNPDQFPMFQRTNQNQKYFFTAKDGIPTSGIRHAGAGVWIVEDQYDTVVHGANGVVAMRRTLVFYNGKMPNVHKTHWCMNEFLLLQNQEASGDVALYQVYKPYNYSTPAEVEVEQLDETYGVENFHRSKDG